MIKAEFRVIENSDLIDKSEIMLEVENRFFVLKRDAAIFLLEALAIVDKHNELKNLCDKYETSVESTLEHLKKITLLRDYDYEAKKNVRGFIFRFDILNIKVVEYIAKIFSRLLNPFVFITTILVLAITVYLTFNDLKYYALFGFINQKEIWWNAFSVYLASIFFHEIGHASASWRYAKKCGKIGFGIYYIFPVFYADVTSSWGMERKNRVVTALSGVYFQVIYLIFTLNYGFLMNDPSLYLASFLILMSIIWTLNPVFKFDGYWALLDFIGDKDLRKTAAKNVINEKKLSRKFLGSLIYIALSILYLAFMLLITMNFFQGIISKLNDWQETHFSINLRFIFESTNYYDVFQFFIHLIILLGSLELARRCIEIAKQFWNREN